MQIKRKRNALSKKKEEKHRKFENEKTRHQHNRTNFQPMRHLGLCVCVNVHTLPESAMYLWPNLFFRDFIYRDANWCLLVCAKRTTRNIENPPLRINTTGEHEYYCAAQILSKWEIVFTEQATHTNTHTQTLPSTLHAHIDKRGKLDVESGCSKWKLDDRRHSITDFSVVHNATQI